MKQEKAFTAIKQRITDEKLLKYYDGKKPVTFSVDLSSYGLDVCLLQEGQPVSYASRFLSQSERKGAATHRVWMEKVPSVHPLQDNNNINRPQIPGIPVQEATFKRTT